MVEMIYWIFLGFTIYLTSMIVLFNWVEDARRWRENKKEESKKSWVY